MTEKSLNRLAFLLPAAGLVTLLTGTMALLTLRVATTSGNHWGVEIRWLWPVSALAMLLGIIGLRRRWEPRALATVLLFVGIGSGVAVTALDHFNMLVQYDVWLKRGMPGAWEAETQVDDEVWDETLHQAKDYGFEYTSNYRLAKSGDPRALAKLLEFSPQTDAAGALGHGVALVKVLQAVGDEKFSEHVRRQSPTLRRLTGEMLLCGVDYGLNKELEETGRLFPLSFKATQE